MSRHKLLIFAGTTEGRQLAEFCIRNQISAVVCTATNYGAELLPASASLTALPGRLDSSGMLALICQQETELVIDATHPYAVEATANIRQACQTAGVQCLRLVREETAQILGDTVNHMYDLISELNQHESIILSTLGSKSLSELTKVRNYQTRLWVRVLPSNFEICQNMGFQHVIAENPPFSVEQNISHIQQSHAEILITKESGSAGGYPEKIKAAQHCHIRTITLVRPIENGLHLQEIEDYLQEKL